MKLEEAEFYIRTPYYETLISYGCVTAGIPEWKIPEHIHQTSIAAANNLDLPLSMFNTMTFKRVGKNPLTGVARFVYDQEKIID